jgi:hypothetical protein
MSTPKPTGKTAIAVFGGSGDYCFLQNYKLLYKGHKEANVHFSVESMKTEHGLTVNYAKYEYIEERHWVHGVEYGTHFIFIEFATWDDAMKAMWDGFPLAFASFIFATLRLEDLKKEEWIVGRFEAILDGATPKGYGEHTAWIVNKDLPIARDLEKGGEFYKHIKSEFRTDRFHLIKMPAVETWEQAEDIFKSEWFSDLHQYREMILTGGPDLSLEKESYWKFEEEGTGRDSKFRTEIFVLPEDEGGAPIADGDRRTITDGPNDVEASLSAFYIPGTTVSPGEVMTMSVKIDQHPKYLQYLGSRFAVKQDGKLVALGIIRVWGR